MSDFLIEGKRKLYGEVKINSAKNSVLPLISACILLRGKVILKNVRQISDVKVMCEIFETLGGKYRFYEGNLYLDGGGINSYRLPEDLTSKIRASFFTVGALLSRFSRVLVKMPGGCNIGERPVDIHIAGLKKMGVEVYEKDGVYYFERQKNSGDVKIRLSFPSVGATENLILASVLNGGETILQNCAREPEIEDLQNFLNALGAKVVGGGSSEIRITGVKKLTDEMIEYTPITDRIEAGTFILAACACGGDISISNINIKFINILLKNIRNNACKIVCNNDKINISCESGGMPVQFIRTGPYPLFPTDLQPQFVAAMLTREDFSVIEEDVFEKRFSYLEGIRAFGGNVELIGNRAIISKSQLHGANVRCGDLRGGAALVIAALAAEGRSVVSDVGHIDRGYYAFEDKLTALGAKIERVTQR